jgi:putative redox protein
MQMVIDFPGGSRVDAHFGSFTLPTDQPPQGGGAASAPTPFATFLGSIGTCAGIYVLGFCRQRGVSTAGMRIIQNPVFDPETGLVTSIHLDIQLPKDFPEKYRTAVVRAADQCLVKKHLEAPPKFEISTSTLAG